MPSSKRDTIQTKYFAVVYAKKSLMANASNEQNLALNEDLYRKLNIHAWPDKFVRGKPDVSVCTNMLYIKCEEKLLHKNSGTKRNIWSLLVLHNVQVVTRTKTFRSFKDEVVQEKRLSLLIPCLFVNKWRTRGQTKILMLRDIEMLSQLPQSSILLKK